MSENVSVEWMDELEFADKALDPLGHLVFQRFNRSVMWQGSEEVNGMPLRDVLTHCYDQQNGILSVQDREIVDAMGVDAYINITATKTNLVHSFLGQTLTSGPSLPWTVMPTPRPELSPAMKMRVLDEVRAYFFEQAMDGKQLAAFAYAAKRKAYAEEVRAADKAAAAMMELITDQCEEGGFYNALTGFIHDFAVYPFSVFLGPRKVKAPRMVWGRNKPRLVDEMFYTFRHVSPWDFLYTPDSPDCQRGSGVFVREYWTRRELVAAATMPGYIKRNILDVLEKCDTNSEFTLRWLTRDPDKRKRDIALWSSNVAPIEVLTHYGLFSGRELGEYGVSGLDDHEFYEAEVALCGYRVIKVVGPVNPAIPIRPVYTASFYRTSADRIPGEGIAQRLRDVERCYLACLRYLMQNAAMSSAPITEVNFQRVQQWMNEEDVGKVVPGTMYLADDSPVGNTPAFKFYSVPSNLPAYSQLMEMFLQLADRVTNLPAQLHGEAVGSGALRTFRGMESLQGNATRSLESAVKNISEGVFEPLGELLYMLNMMYSPDATVKGDAKIVSRGAVALLKKQQEKTSAMEILQVLGAAGQQFAGVANMAPLVKWALLTILPAMNVPEHVVEAMEGPSMGAMPNPNPNPGAGAPPAPAEMAPQSPM